MLPLSQRKGRLPGFKCVHDGTYTLCNANVDNIKAPLGLKECKRTGQDTKPNEINIESPASFLHWASNSTR